MNVFKTSGVDVLVLLLS